MQHTKFIITLILLIQWITPLSAAPAEFVAASESDFAHPHDIALDPSGKFLLVSDMQNDVVRVINPQSLKTISTIGEGELSSPHDVSFDSQGRLLVADSGNNRIVIFEFNNGSGTVISSIAENMRSPEGVCADSDGHIYVASTGNHTILKFKNNKLIKRIGGRGKNKAQFIRPHDIEMSADGLLYVSDPGNNRIQILSDALVPIEIIQPKSKPLNEPKYLALDKQGHVFIADQHNNLLRIFDHQRNEIHAISKANHKTLNNIEGVEYVDGKLWIADTYNNRIVLFHWTP